MPNVPRGSFSMRVTIESDVDFDDAVDQIVDATAELGWTCHGVGEPGQLFLHIVGDTTRVTAGAKDTFCKWIETLDGVSSFDVVAKIEGS